MQKCAKFACADTLSIDLIKNFVVRTLQDSKYSKLVFNSRGNKY